MWIARYSLIWCLLELSVAFSASNSNKPIPITVLSGFLGSGKTTLLQNLLQNKQGLKIAVVVNDVASVNIDSKLVARGDGSSGSTSLSDGMVELQNGCACCSLSDELLASVSELVTLSDLRQDDEQFQHIVVELSGVADPKSVRAKFQEAAMAQMPLMERVELDTLVTLVDASMFESHFESTKPASRKEMPELYYRDGEAPPALEQEEWMKDLPPKLLEVVMAGFSAEDENPNGVADLLVSQTETADLVVLNKRDLVSSEQLQRLRGIIQALNPRAKIITTEYGQIPLTQVLAMAQGQGVAVAGAVDDHRDYVSAASLATECSDPDCTDESHVHNHEHANACTDDTHDHSHSHDHGACNDPDCTDDSHDHSHSDDHAACNDSDCTDESHSHSHSHDQAGECKDPDCTDETHSHSHSHESSHGGIGTFVYRARRPFHPGRLVALLHQLPVVRGIPEIKETLEVAEDTSMALKLCLRSKGFLWCADSHKSAMYWSHAGASFELSCLGQWWATLPRNQWPEGVDDYVLKDFDDIEHDDSTNNVGVGDRRQEIVFIGPNYGKYQTTIRECLNQCLLTDSEYKEYQSMQSEESKLQARFANAIESKLVSY